MPCCLYYLLLTTYYLLLTTTTTTTTTTTIIIIVVIIIISLVNKKQIYSTYPMFIYVELAFGGHCLHFQVYTINSVI